MTTPSHVVEGDPQFRLAPRQLLGSSIKFVEEPRVLDRDHRLVAEGADEIDLPL
jgi:hypothetical protein